MCSYSYLDRYFSSFWVKIAVDSFSQTGHITVMETAAPGTNMTPETYTIPEYQFGDFVTRMAKLNRKAKRLGCPAASYHIQGETVLTVKRGTDEFGKAKVYHIPAKIVAVDGVAPQVGNHQLLARIEYLSDSKSKLFHTVPGFDIKVDERFRELNAGVCEHCNTHRFRKDTFVVRDTTNGEQKQIGRNCLADFIGGTSPETIAARAAYLKLFDDIGSSEGNDGYRSYFVDKADTRDVLRLTSACISLFGWVPKSQAGEGFRATAGRVAMHFMPSTAHLDQADKDEMFRVSSLAKEVAHEECADKVINWIKTDLSKSARSDYELNLCTLVVGELTETRHLGLVCSAVSAYQRAMNRGIEYAKKHIEAAKSEFIGAAGDKFKALPVSVQFVKSMDGAYGPITLIKFVDEKGNILTWFASGDKRYTPGEKLVISGTIKKQNERDGIKETMLTRVKAAA